MIFNIAFIYTHLLPFSPLINFLPFLKKTNPVLSAVFELGFLNFFYSATQWAFSATTFFQKYAACK